MTEITALPVAPSLLGESPLWHPDEQLLYWVDIPGLQLNRFHPGTGRHDEWHFPSEPACIAPLLGGGLLMAMRDGLWRFDAASGKRSLVAAPPYDPAGQRFNDGKADAQGRFWVGTLDDQREPRAALYCLDGGSLQRKAGGITVSNGLAFSPDGRTLLWADTKAHCIQAFDLDASDGSLSRQRLFAQFAPRDAAAPLASYGGRPDGAAMDSEGACWVAMFEGQRLLRLAPDGSVRAELALPVRCPTMPCFGGPDLKTLYITTAREKRPAQELADQPLAGCVLQCRVEVPGLPAHVARL
jgi:sugar lactone lactonase YvrE